MPLAETDAATPRGRAAQESAATRRAARLQASSARAGGGCVWMRPRAQLQASTSHTKLVLGCRKRIDDEAKVGRVNQCIKDEWTGSVLLHTTEKRAK